MGILDINYVSKKVEDGRITGKKLIEENSTKLNNMISNNTDETRKVYREVRDRFDRHTYRTLFYFDAEQLLRNGETQTDIINNFKTRLNKEQHLLEKFRELYTDEHPMMVGTPLANKRLEVEELEKFMEDEIYILL